MTTEFLDSALRQLLSSAAPADHGDTSADQGTASEHGAAGGHGGGHAEECHCFAHHSHGTEKEAIIAKVCMWFAFTLSIGILIFYAYHTYKATCGWEEVYVCFVELIKVTLEIFFEPKMPATVKLIDGTNALWIRYGEWLLTCPVILIQLSNITGLHDDYSPRTMTLLVSDIGTIVWGVTAALTKGPVKILFFFIGLSYGCNTFFTASKVYIESYHMVPKGNCQLLVKVMAYIFFVSWLMFPLLFVFGPEGFGHISPHGSTIAHTVVDLMSKNIWGLVGHHLRVKIHEHILIHGDFRKKKHVNIAGEDREIEMFCDEGDEEGVKQSTKALAKRESFLIMRENLKKRGIDVRASLDAGEDPLPRGMEFGPPSGKQAYIPQAPPIEAGRVILGVPDVSMVDYFKEQFAALPAPIELVPALGAENIVSTVQQANNMGGCDCVLLHPDFLRDKSPTSVVSRLKMGGQRIIAYGWTPMGPMKDLIETSPIDAWLEGPSFGSGLNAFQLQSLLAQMQKQRRAAHSMHMMGMNSNHGLNTANYGMGHPPSPMAYTNQPGSPHGMNTNRIPSMTTMGGSPGQMTTNRSPTPPASGNANEQDMLHSLMSEINRLKAELGENV